MVGVVERRADEIVHRRIDDDEGLGLAALHIEDAGNQDAGVADDEAAGLEDQLQSRSRLARSTTTA